MGLIKGIANVIKEKAKEELLEYIKKVMDDEKEALVQEKKEEKILLPEPPKQVEAVKEILPEPTKEEKKEEKKEEFISKMIDEELVKISIERKSDEIVINRRFASDIQNLSLEEFALYMKFYFYSFTQKKNFGYLGNTLRKKLELDEMSQEKFDSLVLKLEKRGLLKTEAVSLNQTTFILYFPFDDETMKRVEELKKKENEKEEEPSKEELPKKQSAAKAKKNEKKEAELDIEDDAFAKQYKTFVAMEIDKAKMRVGRSSFDKIYMEAVKYIDKKYGFSVLSDSEKFKDYLTQYYISAFDILTFNEWKKTKEHSI